MQNKKIHSNVYIFVFNYMVWGIQIIGKYMLFEVILKLMPLNFNYVVESLRVRVSRTYVLQHRTLRPIPFSYRHWFIILLFYIANILCTDIHYFQYIIVPVGTLRYFVTSNGKLNFWAHCLHCHGYCTNKVKCRQWTYYTNVTLDVMPDTLISKCYCVF